MQNEEGSTPVTVITRYHRYTGMLANQGFRIADIFNDHRTDLLEMYDVLATGVGTGSKDVRFDRIVLKKDSVLLVLPQGKYEAPVHRRNRYIERDHYGAMVAMPVCILSGILHMPIKPIPSLVLAENSTLPEFLAMANVIAHNSLHNLIPTQCDVAILQRRAIESLQLTAQPLTRRRETIG